jgi:hypothetical protein
MANATIIFAPSSLVEPSVILIVYRSGRRPDMNQTRRVRAVSISKRPVLAAPSSVEQVIAPTAIERALSVYQQLKERDQSVLLQARKILTQHIYGMIDQGENDEHRLTVSGLAHLKAIERDRPIKSAQDSAKRT